MRADRGGPVIAIDGPSGSGKSTVARAVATRLGLRYLDTGAMYRAATAAVLAAGIDPDDAAAVAAYVPGVELEISTEPAPARVSAGGSDLTTEIRGPAVTAAVSAVSAVPAVRAAMVARQRRLIGAGGIVVEGRDIGTVVAPAADLKVFLTADPAARAARRALETDADVGRTEADLARRDRLDTSRAASPLAQAPDALVLDSTDLDPDAVVAEILAALDRAAAPAGQQP
ncbi:MAG: CMP/dCMP kinase [Frankiaceae bacterium]|nr:CMP/dCMP kinase [Frankiaceae bacterium]